MTTITAIRINEFATAFHALVLGSELVSWKGV